MPAAVGVLNSCWCLIGLPHPELNRQEIQTALRGQHSGIQNALEMEVSCFV